jgi:hypothetical protein
MGSWIASPHASSAQVCISRFSNEIGNIRTGFAKTRAGSQKPPALVAPVIENDGNF